MIALLWINLAVVLIFLSGFVDSVDEAIERKWRFHHLPKPFSCALCMTFWLSIIWVIVTGNFSILGVLLCLVNAHLTEITSPLISMVKSWLLRVIEWLMPR